VERPQGAHRGILSRRSEADIGRRCPALKAMVVMASFAAAWYVDLAGCG
jgi:hypothetical protein